MSKTQVVVTPQAPGTVVADDTAPGWSNRRASRGEPQTAPATAAAAVTPVKAVKTPATAPKAAKAAKTSRAPRAKKR